MENNIPTLEELLNDYEAGKIEVGGSARKYYMTEAHKYKNIVSWIHDHELKNQLLLKNIGKRANKDLLRNTR
jgi:hypothetical protein